MAHVPVQLLSHGVFTDQWERAGGTFYMLVFIFGFNIRISKEIGMGLIEMGVRYADFWHSKVRLSLFNYNAASLILI